MHKTKSMYSESDIHKTEHQLVKIVLFTHYETFVWPLELNMTLMINTHGEKTYVHSL